MTARASDRGFILFLILACCGIGYADPFVPTLPMQDQAVPAAPAPEYRVLGIVVSKSQKAAVLQLPDSRIRVVRPGERVGDAIVARITSDAVHLDTGSGVLYLPVSDR